MFPSAEQVFPGAAPSASCSRGICRSPDPTAWLPTSLHLWHQPREPIAGHLAQGSWVRLLWLVRKTMCNPEVNEQHGIKQVFFLFQDIPQSFKCPGPNRSFWCIAEASLLPPLRGEGQNPSAFLRGALSSWVDLHLPQLITCNGIWQCPESTNGAGKHLTAARPLGHFCASEGDRHPFTGDSGYDDVFQAPRQPCKKETQCNSYTQVIFNSYPQKSCQETHKHSSLPPTSKY